ncbi:hypothetical protein P9112_012288 [Eukaryota sp. TZLM1-RC]
MEAHVNRGNRPVYLQRAKVDEGSKKKIFHFSKKTLSLYIAVNRTLLPLSLILSARMNRFTSLKTVFSSSKPEEEPLYFTSSTTAHWGTHSLPLGFLIYEDAFSVFDLSQSQPTLAYSTHSEHPVLAITPLHHPPQPLKLPPKEKSSKISFERPAVLVAVLKNSHVLLEIHPLCSKGGPQLVPNSLFAAPQPEYFPDVQLFSSRHAIVFAFSHHISILCPSTLTPLKQLSLPGVPLCFAGRYLALSQLFTEEQQKSSSNLASSAPIMHSVVSTTTSVVKSLGSRAAQLTGNSPQEPPDCAEDGVNGVAIIDVVSSIYSSSPLPVLICSCITHSRPVVEASFCNRGVRLLVADGKCRLINLLSLLPNPSLEATLCRGATPAKPVSMSFSLDHRWAAVMTSHGTAHIFSAINKSNIVVERTLRLRHSVPGKTEEELDSRQHEGRKMSVSFLSGSGPRTYKVLCIVFGKIYSHFLTETPSPNPGQPPILKEVSSDSLAPSPKPKQGERKLMKKLKEEEVFDRFEHIEVVTCSSVGRTLGEQVTVEPLDVISGEE